MAEVLIVFGLSDSPRYLGIDDRGKKRPAVWIPAGLSFIRIRYLLAVTAAAGPTTAG